MAEHHHARSGILILASEAASERGLKADHREEVGRHNFRRQVLWVAHPGQGEVAVAVRGQRRE
jgi:hypothetical protein